MDTQSIKTFVLTAKLGNFTKAAEELNYAQSTVTMQIQRLEKELGFPLFEKIGRKTQLTANGKEFLIHAEKLLHIVQSAGMIGQDAKNMKGSIFIGVLESLLFAKLLPILSEFRKEFPNLEVNLKIGQASELRSLLKQNKLDIIYISGASNTDITLQCYYKSCEELVFTTAATHPLADQKNVDLHQIFQYPFIVTEPTGYCYGRLSEIASEQDCVLSHSMVLDSIIAICALLGDGHSIAFLPKYALIDQFDAGVLTTLDANCAHQIYYSQLLCSKGKWISPFLESLISHIKNAYPEKA